MSSLRKDLVKRKRPSPPPLYWNRYARKVRRAIFEERIARHKKDVHLDLIGRWAPLLEGQRILKTDSFEEAFGSDAFLDALATRARFAAGMDISAEIASRAKRRFPGLAFAAADIVSLPFKNAAFDLVVSNSTLDHLVSQDVLRGLKELARVLRPGGGLILTLDNKHNPLHIFSHWMRRVFGWFYTDRCYSVPESVALLKKSGFRALEATAIFHVPFPVNFMAKAADLLLGGAAVPLVEKAVHFFSGWERRPTRFLTGRHIALKAEKNLEIR
jgi:SAM-dependent methyltransferase